MGTPEPIGRSSALEPRANDLDDDLAARGADPALRELIDGLVPAAESTGPVMLMGESGVGKEYFARQIHRLRWGTDDGFCAVLAGGLPSRRFEALLRGETGDRTRGRVLSLFVKNIELLAEPVQVVLADWLAGGDYTAEGAPFFMAATQANLAERVRRGQFDWRALARFEGRRLLVPALRARREDRIVVASELLSEIACETRRPPACLSAQAWKSIMEKPWHGNVRELLNHLRQALLVVEPQGSLSL